VALFTVALGDSYYPDVVPGISHGAALALGFATVIGLFASVVAHELGHAVVARRDGVVIEEIDLWPLGGIARMKALPDTADAELRMAVAGPAVSVVLALTLTAAAAATPRHGALALHESLGYLGLLNGILAVFNLIPALPLDGGRVAHALLWKRSGQRDEATLQAARAGRFFGWLFVAFGLTSLLSGVGSGLWLAAIGAFVLFASAAEARQAIVHEAFDGVPARALMSAEPDVVREHATVLQAAEQFAQSRHTAMPVVDAAGTAVGLVSLTDVARVHPGDRRDVLVASIMRRDGDLRIEAGDDVAELLQRPVFAEVGRAVVVDDAGRPVGIVSITDVESELRSRALLGTGAPHR
jgi:Zn-dependent protease